jgi:hypothetical protein
MAKGSKMQVHLLCSREDGTWKRAKGKKMKEGANVSPSL